MRRKILKAYLALPVLGFSSSNFVLAQSNTQLQPWPSAKPIRLVLPSGPGGGADIFGRCQTGP